MGYIIPVIILIAVAAVSLFFVREGRRVPGALDKLGALFAASILPFILTVLIAFLALMLTRNQTGALGLVIGCFLALEGLMTLAIFCLMKRPRAWVAFLSAAVIYAAALTGYNAWWTQDQAVPKLRESATLLTDYNPVLENSLCASLDAPSELHLEDNFPRLDGATALYPVYAAFARAVYPAEALQPGVLDGGYYSVNTSDLISCSTTTNAYQRLVDGEVDLIFAAGPSDAQLEYAAAKGEEMLFTPIGREAFVFFVNAENPVTDAAPGQLRGIYSGQITDWSELGANLGKIRAFQRDEGSGSQSTLIRFMGDVPLMEAPSENIVDGMGGIIERTADYKNYKNAIGYSFRFYSTEMVKNDQIRLLSVGGIEPTKENILNGSYPLASEFFAVHLASNENPNVPLLLEWILSPQGQELIDRTGYVGLK